jgi:hypothetical protein
MTGDKKDEDQGTDLSEYARDRPKAPPVEVEDWKPVHDKDDSVGKRILRGCGIAVGIAALIFFFIAGACFIAYSQW